MKLQYAVFWRRGAWRVFREDAELGAYASREEAVLTAQHLAGALAADGGTLDVVVQNPTGELRTLRVGGAGPLEPA